MNPVILYDNRFLDGTPTATDMAAGYDVLNIRDNREFTSWKANGPGTKYLTVDCSIARNVDALAICKHNLATAAASVSVESSDGGGVWTERIAPFTPSSNQPCLKFLSGVVDGVRTDTGSDGAYTDTGTDGAWTVFGDGGSVSARYWRIKIVTATIAPQIAIVLLGERMEFPSPPVTPFAPIRVSIERETTRSKSGAFLGEVIRYKPFKIDAKWSVVSRSFVEGRFVPFWLDHASNLLPFVWAWDFGAYPEEVRFVRLDPSHEHGPEVSVLAFYESITLPMEGVL